MKKLLGLLSSIAILGSTSSVAVSCGSSNTRITTPTLNIKKAQEIIAELIGDKNFNFTYSDLLSDADITTALVNEIDKLVSLNWDYDKTNEMLSTGQGLNLSQYKLDTKGSNDAFKQRFDNLINTVAEDKLFSEYSKSVVDGTSSSLDHTLLKEYYSFNPTKETTIKGVDKKEYTVAKGTQIKFGSSSSDAKIWQLFGENKANVSQIPTLAELTSDKFFVEANAVANDVELGDSTVVEISAKTALSLRFQDYFNYELSSIMDNALTMVYNQTSMWRIQDSGEKETSIIDGSSQINQKMPYIDITNPIFSKTQSWDSSDFYTNTKMVWTYTISKDDYSGVKTAISQYIDANGYLNDDATISDLFTALGKFNNKDKKDAVDPYFNYSGYKGIVISQNGTSIGDNPISGASYESAVNTKANMKTHGGIAIQNANLPYFVNADDTKNYDIVIYLPVYMIQLLGVDYVDSIKTDEQSYVYSVSGADSTKSKKIQFQRSADSTTTYKTIWQNNTYFESKDVDKIVKDSEKRDSLLQEIEYLVSQESNNSSNAKKIIYSKYLNADDIYYAGLYDQIGTYISKDDNEDE